MKHYPWRRFSQFRDAMAVPVALAVLLLATETEARAYTDPGTGALIWQMLVAAAVGGLFYFRKLLAWLRPGKKDRQD